MASIPRQRRLLPSARLLAALTLGFACALAAAAAKRGDAESQLKEVRERIDDLARKVREDGARRNTAAAQLRDAELKVARSQGELTRLRAERTASQHRRDELTQQRADAAQSLEQERDSLAGQLRAAYTLGREEQMRLLLNQQDPVRLGRMFAYYSYFGRSRAAKISTINEQLLELERLNQEVEAENQRLAALEQAAQQEFDTVKSARSERSTALNSLEKDIKNRKGELARLKQEEAALQKLLADLRKVMSDFPLGKAEPFEKVKGRLGWPVDGRIVADFGQRRATGMTWDGVLLATERGSKVRAVYFGRVIYADWLQGMGLLTIVEHSGGYLSLYGHNEQLYKAVGEWVEPGDVIAGAGDSGGRSQPGLYFEIRKGSRPLNPHQWIKKK